MAKRIGIPRALLYYRYYDLWREIFGSLGFDLITSASTNEEILKDGLRVCTTDLCLPVKAMLGHVENLKDFVDYLFIPRYVSVEKDAYMCPKVIGLPDVIKASFGKLPPIIEPIYNAKGKNTLKVFAEGIARPLGIKEKVIISIISNLNPHSEKTPHRVDKEVNSPRIALLGRPYLISDSYLSKGIVGMLKSLGSNVIIEEPSQSEVESAMSRLPKWLYWSMSKEVTALAYKYFNDTSIDGVINLSNAACGPDSFTGEIINRLREGSEKPYMSISIDEHTSAVGIQTRVEAFLDMITISNEKRT